MQGYLSLSPFVSVAPHVEMGEGCVINGSVGDNVKLGNFVHIAGSMIAQDSIIDDYSTTTGFVNTASAKIGKRVFIGNNSVVLNHLKVGDDAFICAGSLVFSNIKAGKKVWSNHARRFEI